MRKYYLFIFILISITIISCNSTKEITSETDLSSPETVDENTQIVETIEEETSIEDDFEYPENDIISDEEIVEEYVETDDVEFIDDETDLEDEYLRSIEEINSEEAVSQQEFFDDKAAILQIISELSVVIDENDVNSWLTYLDPESKKYYSNPANLRKAQRKLPNKLILLKTIKDYFENVFIPARRASKVDEIRYISKTEVKAVEVKEDNSIVVYYYFKKINDKWFVNLPTI